MPQPRAPPAELTGDVAGGSSDLGLQPSHSGRPMVGCFGVPFLRRGNPPPSGVMHPLVVFDGFDDFGGDFGDFGDDDAT